QRSSNGYSALVHVRHWLQRPGLASGQRPFRNASLKPHAPWRKWVTRVDHVHRHKARVVTVARVLGTGIAESGDEKRCVGHGRAEYPRAGLLLLRRLGGRSPL